MAYSIAYIVICNLALLNFGTEMVINFWLLPYILPTFLLLKSYLSNINMLLIIAAINTLLATIINVPILIKNFTSDNLFSITFVYLIIFIFEFIYSGVLILRQRKSQNKADRYAFTQRKYFSALMGVFAAIFFVLPLYIAFVFAVNDLSTALGMVLILSNCFTLFVYCRFRSICAVKSMYILSAFLTGVVSSALLYIMLSSHNPQLTFGNSISIYFFYVYNVILLLAAIVFDAVKIFLVDKIRIKLNKL